MSKMRFGRLIKLFLMFLSSLLLVSICSIMIACESEGECEHQYDETITVSASCSANGEATYSCVKCGDIYAVVLPALEHHPDKTGFSAASTDSEHYYKCTACGQDIAEPHLFAEVEVAPTCTVDGSSKRQCECGVIQSGSDIILDALGHAYSDFIGILQQPTCEHEGKASIRCSICKEVGEEVIEALGHDWTIYNYDQQTHWKQCSRCKAEQTDLRQDHIADTSADSVILQAGDCETDRIVKYSCLFCKIEFTETMQAKGHYDIKEYPAKEMTDTEPGNRHYWQCQACQKYFTSHSCVEELTAEQVFTYPPKHIEVDGIAKLFEIAESIAEGSVSVDYYEVTAMVDGVIAESNILMLTDKDDTSIFVTLSDVENAYTINEKDEVVLKGKLLKRDGDVTLIDCKLIFVDCHDDELHSLFFTVTKNSPNLSVYVYAEDELEEVYCQNTNNYNCLIHGTELVFYYSEYSSKAVLQKIIINGKAQTASNGVFRLLVVEDIYIEFVFSTHNYCSVTLRDVDATNNNGNEIIVDEYISYIYKGNYNDEGRIYANSHLTFTANNAYITGINITYDADWLDDNPNVLNNTINAIRANGIEISVSQEISAKNPAKVVIVLSFSDNFTVLDYFADACQARVAEITVLYQTYNTF